MARAEIHSLPFRHCPGRRLWGVIIAATWAFRLRQLSTSGIASMGVKRTVSNCTVSVTTPSFTLVVHVIEHPALDQRGQACIQRSRSFISSLGLTGQPDRKSTRLNSSHANISYAVFC